LPVSGAHAKHSARQPVAGLKRSENPGGGLAANP
jgi:hypothetical protein